MSSRNVVILATVLSAALAAPLGLVLGGGLGFGIAVSIVVAVLAALAAGWRAAGSERPQTACLEGAAGGFVVLAVLGAVLAVLSLAGLGIFIHDPAHKDLVWHHAGDFGVRHNCFTAYAFGAWHERDGIENVYDSASWKKKTDTALHASLGDRFSIDMYPYPPTLMALTRGFLAVSDDFLLIRRWWYLIVVGVFLFALARTASWCGAFAGHRALLLAPWIVAAPSALTGLQIQNVHPLVISASVLGMIAHRERREKTGALLLAIAMVCKIWPGLLLVPLAVAGRWRAVFATVIATAALVGVGVMVLGIDVHRDFITYQIPRLQSGDAFWFMGTNARPITANASLFGITHKLHEMKLLAEDPPVMNGVVGWVYTVLLLGAAVLLGRSWRGADGDDHAARLTYMRGVLALLVLAQLRSPFLPWPYGVIAGLWLVVLCAPGARGPRAWLLAGAFAVLAPYIPFPNGVSNLAYWWGIAGTFVLAALSVATVFGLTARRRSR